MSLTLILFTYQNCGPTGDVHTLDSMTDPLINTGNPGDPLLPPPQPDLCIGFSQASVSISNISTTNVNYSIGMDTESGTSNDVDITFTATLTHPNPTIQETLRGASTKQIDSRTRTLTNIFDSSGDIASNIFNLQLNPGNNRVRITQGNNVQCLSGGGSAKVSFETTWSCGDESLSSNTLEVNVNLLRGPSASSYLGCLNTQKVTALDSAPTTGNDVQTESGFGNIVLIKWNLAVIMAPNHGSTSNGAAFVYRINNGSWSFEQKLTPATFSTAQLKGVAMSDDGNTLFLGAASTRSTAGIPETYKNGVVYIYRYSSGNWSKQAQELLPSGSANVITTGDHFGESLDASGGYLIVGAPGDNGSTQTPAGLQPKLHGAVYVYANLNSTLTFEQKITPSDRQIEGLFGSSVAIDGNTLVVGAPVTANNYSSDYNISTGPGAAYVFEKSGGIFSQSAKLSASTGDQDHFGVSVDVKGANIVVGAYGEGSGFAYLYKGGFNGTPYKLTAQNVSGFGISVSLDSTSLVVGSHTFDNNKGAGFYYNLSGVGSDLEKADYKIMDEFRSDTNPALLGASVSVSNGQVLMGAPLSNLEFTIDGITKTLAGSAFFVDLP